MDQYTYLVRPVNLIEGADYLLLEPGHKGEGKVFKPVRLTAYDACPAFVIVLTEYGKKQRCPRESLFIANQSGLRAQ
jgi:hypothetical protein